MSTTTTEGTGLGSVERSFPRIINKVVNANLDVKSVGVENLTQEVLDLIGDGGGSGLQIGSVDLHNGGVQSAQILKFDDVSKQSVITGPTPASGSSAQRIIIQGQRASGSGEGGDVYLWGGDADANGGDIKIYAGDADNVSPNNGNGGYVNIDGGRGVTNGGNVEITGGYSEGGQAGSVNIFGGTTSSGVAGNVMVRANSNDWVFNENGHLSIPGDILLNNGTSVAVGTYDNGYSGNNGVSLNCAVGYELNWQAGRLKSTSGSGEVASSIYIDSPITYFPTVVSLSYVANLTIDAKLGEIFDITLAGDITLENPINPTNGKTIRFRVLQDGVGGRTVTLGSKFNAPPGYFGPWSTDPNKMDSLTATYHEGRDKWDIALFIHGY
jgi:hypothetical protein